MEITGEERITAKREIVWKTLNSANALRKCIPNCETLDKKSPTEMVATVKFKVGPIPATFRADVNLTKRIPPESYTIVVDGQGGLAGSGKGTCDVKLVQDGPETVLTYTVNAQMSGALAKVGAKMVDSGAKKVTTAFFKKFGKIAANRAAKAAQKADEKKQERQKQAQEKKQERQQLTEAQKQEKKQERQQLTPEQKQERRKKAQEKKQGRPQLTEAQKKERRDQLTPAQKQERRQKRLANKAKKENKAKAEKPAGSE